ncbi:hypothetical protein ACS0TY_000092 [Phlomoides rotata]
MDSSSTIGNNDIDDVRWLCTLTEAEIDLLIGLKSMVKLRAEKIGHEDLGKKFDLKMLRAFFFSFMEHLKEASGIPSCSLNQNLSGNFDSTKIEDLYPYFCSDQRKRITDMFSDDMPPAHKQKTSK